MVPPRNFRGEAAPEGALGDRPLQGDTTMNRSDFEGKIRRGKYAGPGFGLFKADSPIPGSYGTAGNTTLTAADIYGGLVLVDPNGAARNITTPTAAQLVAVCPGVAVGDVVSCLVMNGSDGAADAENLTIVGGTGVTFDTNEVAAARVVRSQTSRLVNFRFTNVTVGSEAVVCYM